MLVDTNVLLRVAQPAHSMHASAVRALALLMEREAPLSITIQNIAEFWNAATRPAADNGLGFTIEEAHEEIIKLDEFFEVLSETPESYEEWKALVVTNRVSGVKAHDARLVAVMKTNGIAQILTFNVGDFSRFSDIEAIHPDKVDHLGVSPAGG